MKEEKNKEIKVPVVVVLGHVDHGKSTLLEAIRKEIRIVARESGGITQHIGAYEIEKDGKKITFIDTPGHEAFKEMRSRGAEVADVAILVVDAGESVKPQTKESIKAVKKADIPLIVALNKMDKSQAQPDWVKGELKKEGIIVESLGGKVPAVEVSAKEGKGIEELLETISLVAEIEELKVEKDVPAEGAIIESALDPRKGVIATLIPRKGTLKKGDIIATPSVKGKVKQLIDFQGKQIEKCLPSQPAALLGFEEAPEVGQQFKVFGSLESAEEFFQGGEKKEGISEKKDQKEKTLKIILKADVKGSLEALKSVLKELSHEEVELDIIKSEVGNINAGDIKLANDLGARIFGFRVKMEKNIENTASQLKVFPKTFDVIYELVDEIKQSMERMLSPEIKRIDLGKIKILALFKKSKKGQIIGGRVVEGEITKDTLAEVYRNKEKIGQGKIKSMEEEKRTISSAGKGKEVGMLFIPEEDIDIKEDDILHVYKKEKVDKTL